MAYVALSRVCSLDGLYLTDLDPSSTMVSNSCLEEINRLRSICRKDLPQYEITESSSRGTKRRYNIALDDQVPLLKKPCKMVSLHKPYKKKSNIISTKNAC